MQPGAKDGERTFLDINDEEKYAAEGHTRKMAVSGIPCETVLTDTPMASATKLCVIFLCSNTLIV